MSICTHCRLAIRQSLRTQRPRLSASRIAKASYSTPSTTVDDMLSKPTWSISTLLSSSTPTETITPSQLHHLLRLSSLPLPNSPEEEQEMISTLQSQLRFVRAVQQVDTTNVEPLRAIRDETEQGVKEETIGLAELKDVLAKEEKVGYYQRPRRVREKRGDGEREEEERWDVLGTAGRRKGRFFVVDAGKKAEEGA